MAASRQAADILELRMVLLGVNPLIWRHLLVRTDASVAPDALERYIGRISDLRRRDDLTPGL